MGVCQASQENDQGKKGIQKGKNKGDQIVKIVASTWTRDSHGLFDYETNSIHQQTIKLRGSYHVLQRQNNEVLVGSELVSDKGCKNLLTLNFKDDSYWLSAVNQKEQQGSDIESSRDILSEESLWMAIRNTKQIPDYKGHCLKVGECFKFGRIKYLVKDISLGPIITGDELNPAAFARRQAEREKVKPKEFPEDDNNADEESKCESPQLQLSETQTRACRICLMDGSEWDSPLITPCECCGTMKYVHVKCLAHWLQSRIKTRTTGAVTSVVWKALECELCKKPLSEKCESGGKSYDLVTFPKPNQGPYITLELITKEKANQTRGIIILNLAEKNQLRLGRGHDCDVRIHDISVSRCHATITYNKNGIFLEDKNSKFGSLVLLNSPTRLTEDSNGLTLQIGRTVFEIQVEKDKKWGLMFSCFNGGNTVSIEKLEREDVFVQGQDVSIKRQTSSGPAGPFGPLISYNISPQPGFNHNHHPHVADSGSPNLRADEDFDIIPDENNDVNQNIRPST